MHEFVVAPADVTLEGTTVTDNDTQHTRALPPPLIVALQL